MRRSTTIRTAITLLLVSVCALVALGIVMLASTSSVRAMEILNDPYFFFRKQLVWLGLGVVTAYGAARIEYSVWRRMAVPLALVAIVLLILVFVPGIGVKVGGSHRWMHLGPMRLQPSEVAKIALIVGLAAWLSRAERRVKDVRYGLLLPLAGIGLACGLLILEPDFGTTLLCGVVGMAILYAGGTRISYLVVTGAGGVCLFALAIMNNPHRLGRVLGFLYPEKYPATAYHLEQSKLAFINGGLFGVGLGNSIQKQFYLPEAHTDFILAIIGEELGMIATLGVVLLFACIMVSGLLISARAPDTFGRLLGFGITTMIVLQACINVGVVTGCMPTKGLPLPFISYGGSSLLAALTCVGILISLARAADEELDDVSRSVKDRVRAF